MKKIGFKLFLSCLLVFLLTAMIHAEDKPSTEKTDKTPVGDPVNTASGELFFTKNLFSLGGPYALDFKVYYSSIMKTKHSLDGLTTNFTHNHRLSITRQGFIEPEQIYVQMGLGEEIAFLKGGANWTSAAYEKRPYQLKETDEYFYMMDPVEERIWTFKKQTETLAYGVNGKVSISTDGVQGNQNTSFGRAPSMTSDMRYVVFSSDATNLVSGDTNGYRDIFLRDRLEGTTTRISMGTENGTAVQTDGNSDRPMIAANGRYVVYESDATNLIENDTNNEEEIFLYDIQSGITERVSVANDGSQADNDSDSPSISADGRYVAFASSADNLVSDSPSSGCYIRDRQQNTTVCVSLDSAGNPVNGNSPEISADGSVVAFRSNVNEVVPGVNNNEYDIYIRKLTAGTTALVSVATDGTKANDYSVSPTISSDGRYVAFKSYATNLVDGDTNTKSDIFYHDSQTNTTTRVSIASDGTEGNGNSSNPSISTDGQVVVFASYASTLIANDVNGSIVSDVFLRQITTNKTFLVSQSAFKEQGNGSSADCTVSSGGDSIIFSSKATNLTANDTNGVYDLFVAGKIGASNAYLVEQRDRNGNALTYTNPVDQTALEKRGPDKVQDDKGRELNFTYTTVGVDDTNPYLTKVTDANGRSITFAYEEKPTDNNDAIVLRSIADPLRNVTTFIYDQKQQIKSTKYPEGNIPYTQTFNGSGVVTSQKDAYNNTLTVTKNADEDSGKTKSFTVTYPDSSQETYKHDHSGRVLSSITDADGKIITFQVDPQRDRLIGVTDRLGDSTSSVYHEESGKLFSLTDAEGNRTDYTYSPEQQAFTNPLNDEIVTFTFYDLTRIDRPDGNHEEFTYDGSGNQVTHTRSDSGLWTHTYNANGQVLNKTNPAGGVVTYSYKGDSTLASRTDSDIGVTAFEYDAFKRRVKTTHPDSTFREKSYDLNNRITSRKDENGNTWFHEYDKNGNLIKTTDPATNTFLYTFDHMDRLHQEENRLGHKTTYTYDMKGQKASVTTPDGIQTLYGYNSKGWRIATTIAGKTWNTSFDLEGVISSVSTPMGYTTNYATNNIAKITGRTDALGRSTNYAYDAVGRLTRKTDPLENSTTYTYNQSGLLSSVTVPGVRTASYTRNNQGLITNLKDLNAGEWQFNYTPAGREITREDPLARTISHIYDSLGRLSKTDFADTHSVTRAYDGNGNTIRKLYTDGTELKMTYDALNRIISAGGLDLERDAESNVTHTETGGIEFDAAYDTGGRLSQVSYNNNALVVTYIYDENTGLLSSVSDNITGTRINFSYDDDNRLNAINCIDGDNTVTTNYTLTSVGRITRIQSGSIIDINYSFDDGDRVIQEVSTVPLDPGGQISAEKSNLSFDLAHQITSPGYAYDSRGRLTASPDYTFTWDDASRLTGINSVNLTYNDMNDLISRTEDGVTTSYYYNYAINRKPIMADKDNTTDNFRYYVWTPLGELLYMIDAGDSNKVYYYHFNMTGSTLALTDTTGAVTDAYSYTPFGTLLRQDGNSTQPFTFVGKWGVRQEGSSGTIYHMRARYYDAVTERFISREPLWPAIYDPQELNPYLYSKNEPINNVDISGLNSKSVGQINPAYKAALKAQMENINLKYEAAWSRYIAAIEAKDKAFWDHSTSSREDEIEATLLRDLAFEELFWLERAYRIALAKYEGHDVETRLRGWSEDIWDAEEDDADIYFEDHSLYTMALFQFFIGGHTINSLGFEQNKKLAAEYKELFSDDSKVPGEYVPSNKLPPFLE